MTKIKILTTQILSQNDPLFCVVLIIFYKFSKHNIYAP